MDGWCLHREWKKHRVRNGVGKSNNPTIVCPAVTDDTDERTLEVFEPNLAIAKREVACRKTDVGKDIDGFSISIEGKRKSKQDCAS